MIFLFQINMKEAIIAMKKMIIILNILGKTDETDLPFKSHELPDHNGDRSGKPESHLKTSFCPLNLWFEKISNPYFVCKQQDLDTFNGTAIPRISFN